MSLVKASWTVTFYVLGEPRFDVRCFSHVERRVNQLFRPPVSVFNVNRAPAWAFENNVSVGGHEIGSRADPPEGVNAGALRQFNGPPNEDLTDAPNGLWCVHPGMPLKRRVTGREFGSGSQATMINFCRLQNGLSV
jgi:hypothetical protein